MSNFEYIPETVLTPNATRRIASRVGFRCGANTAFGHARLDRQQDVEIDPRHYRPAEVDLLIGDHRNTRRQLGREPKISFVDLVKLMVDTDEELLHRHRRGKIRVGSQFKERFGLRNQMAAQAAVEIKQITAPQ